MRCEKKDSIRFGTRSSRFAFIKSQKGKVPIAAMCAALGVSRSGFYAWETRMLSPKQPSPLKQWFTPVAAAYRASGGVYGSPRIHQMLRQQGHTIGRHTVAKTMKRLNIQGKSAADYPLKRRRDISAFFQKTPCLIENLCVSASNQLWVADLTYIRIGKDWVYLAAVMDAYSRKVIAWGLGKKKDVAFTLSIMQRAIARRKPPKGLIFHSDRGAEYAAYEYQAVLEKHGIRPSMNRPGKCDLTAKNGHSNLTTGVPNQWPAKPHTITILTNSS